LTLKSQGDPLDQRITAPDRRANSQDLKVFGLELGDRQRTEGYDLFSDSRKCTACPSRASRRVIVHQGRPRATGCAFPTHAYPGRFLK
jgi:hypothetical protein